MKVLIKEKIVEEVEEVKNRDKDFIWCLLSVDAGTKTMTVVAYPQGVKYYLKGELVKAIKASDTLAAGTYHIAKMSPPVTVAVKNVKKVDIEGL